MAKRAFEHQERVYLAQRLRRLVKGALMTSATVLTFVALALLLTDHLFQPSRFEIQQLKITGKFLYSSPRAIQTSIDPAELANFFAVDLSAIKDKVESLPWIAHADVRRQWPDTLSINIIEHRPFMQWQDLKPSASEDRQQFLWVSREGKVIDVATDIERTALRLIGQRDYAADLMSLALQWRAKLALSDLHLLQLKQSETQSLSIRVRLGVEGQPFDVLLGSHATDARLIRFQTLFDKQFRFSQVQLERVDVRYPNGLAILANTPDKTTSLLIDKTKTNKTADVQQSREITDA